MTEVENTTVVLHRYLRTLSVRVSRGSVSRLLAHPLGSSMRGISDALDALRVRNEVYQLPSRDYFRQLPVPFITMQQVERNAFCLVARVTDSTVEYSNATGRHLHASLETFLQTWSGAVLVAEAAADTRQETCFRLKDLFYFWGQYKAVVALVLVVVGAFLHAVHSLGGVPAYWAYLATLAPGIFTAAAILYKEQVDSGFLERFCRIGKAVDCNRVLHSRGSKFLGRSLGELSLLYFFTLYFYSAFCPADFYVVSSGCCLLAVAFTLYSVCYQLAVLRRACLLCMAVCLLVWGNAVCLFLLGETLTTDISVLSCVSFVVIGCVSLTLILGFSEKQATESKLRDREERYATLLRPDVFRKLLELQPSIAGNIPLELTINNNVEGDNRLLLVSNPNCKNCARTHRTLKELATQVPISILLTTHPKDEKGKQVVRSVLAAYQEEGWNKAMELLDAWFEKQKIEAYRDVDETSEADEIRKRQMVYCWRQKLFQTPAIYCQRYAFPNVYALSDIKYLLT